MNHRESTNKTNASATLGNVLGAISRWRGLVALVGAAFVLSGVFRLTIAIAYGTASPFTGLPFRILWRWLRDVGLLNDAVLAALEKRDIDAAQAAARALADVLDGVDVND